MAGKRAGATAPRAGDAAGGDDLNEITSAFLQSFNKEKVDIEKTIDAVKCVG